MSKNYRRFYRDNKTARDQKQTDTESRRPNGSNADGYSGKTKRDSDPPSWVEKGVLLILFLAFLVACYAGYEAKRLADLTVQAVGGAVEANTIARDTAQRQLRAYVGEVFPSIKIYCPDCIGVPAPMAYPDVLPRVKDVLFHTIKNYGTTPARDITVCSSFAPTLLGQTDNELREHLVTNCQSLLHNQAGRRISALWPGATNEQVTPVQNPDRFGDIVSGKVPGILMSIIFYRDVFGHLHTTYICNKYVRSAVAPSFMTCDDPDWPEDD